MVEDFKTEMYLFSMIEEEMHLRDENNLCLHYELIFDTFLSDLVLV